MRQPYGRDIASTVVYAHPVWFARHGYHVVIQDVRGRGDSEGEFYPFRHEGRDGAETIRWLREHPESNGKIGMYGFSYQGMTQLLAAAEQPEGLVCIAPGMTAHDLYHGWFYHHGALRLCPTLGWGLQMLNEDARRLGLKEGSAALETAWLNVRNEPLHAPYRHRPVLLREGMPSYVLNWFDHDHPSHYWTEMDISQSLLQISVPALHVSGWFDTYLNGSIDGFLALTDHAGSEHARKNQYLVAGPWVHIPWGDLIGEQNFGREALLDTDAILLRWFNHWLKDSGEFNAEPKIRHFALGANAWHSAETWHTGEAIELFLRSAGSANSRKGNGSLSDLTACFGGAARHLCLRSRGPCLRPRRRQFVERTNEPSRAGDGKQSACLHKRSTDRAGPRLRSSRGGDPLRDLREFSGPYGETGKSHSRWPGRLSSASALRGRAICFADRPIRQTPYIAGGSLSSRPHVSSLQASRSALRLLHRRFHSMTAIHRLPA